jgi:hypothetical protein
MLTLAQQQQSLAAILRGQAVDVEAGPCLVDPWLANVAQSGGLRMIRQITSWWQRFQIESQCRYTARLMKQMGCFEQYVTAHFAEHPAPASIEELSSQFLSSLQGHENSLLRAVASLELLCITSSDVAERTAIIYWDRNPNKVMDALNCCDGLPEAEAGVRYVLRMSPELPGGISCVLEALPD